MKPGRRINPTLLEWLLPLVILALLLGATYARFFQVPYAGISFSSQGVIVRVYVPALPAMALQEGDQIIQVGQIRWTDFRDDLRQDVFDGLKPGQTIPVIVQRNGQEITVPWVFPGPTPQEVWERIFSEWPIAYAFWLAGTITVLFLRPRDERWRLLIAFNYITALWLIAGSTLSPWHFGEGAILFRMLIWLSVPVYLHLHWIFPQPLKRMPVFAWWMLYALFLVMAVLEWFQILSPNTYLTGLLVALSGSLLLLIAHLIFRRDQRRDLGQMLLIWAVALLPVIAVSIIGTIGGLTTFGGASAVILPALPLAYLYIAYRRRLGQQEIRAHRLIALYLFITLMVAVLALVVPLGEALLPSYLSLFEFIGPVVAVIVAITSFNRFERFVEHRILGAPWPSTHILETYAARITTRLNIPSLVNLLADEVLPSLLIRQSVLLRVKEDRLTLIYSRAIDASQLPIDQQFSELLTEAGHYREVVDGAAACPWARLILPLSLDSEVMGLWLLGRRDPDDFYSQTDSSTLQALANQAAIAIANIDYAQRLHALYQTSIDQREVERASLGRELHDHVLQQMFALQRNSSESEEEVPLAQRYEVVIQAVYQLIRGLRPPMLEYGLYRALAALVDDWLYPFDSKTKPVITLEIPVTDVRYPPHVEQHLFRIVQQAGENAMRHAHARTLKIQGQLDPERVQLWVEDDGIGFDVDKHLDLRQPDGLSHFGLAGMQERAALINAKLKFESTAEQGTRVHIDWYQMK
jgi:signal transduction histidine kinase